MRKRFTAVILALLICVSALPVGSLAKNADAEYVELFFGDFSTSGVDLTDWTTYDYGGSFTYRDQGTISWDDDGKILTLNNVTINGRTGSSAIQFSDKIPTDYTLVLEGTNTITAAYY